MGFFTNFFFKSKLVDKGMRAIFKYKGKIANIMHRNYYSNKWQSELYFNNSREKY